MTDALDVAVDALEGRGYAVTRTDDEGDGAPVAFATPGTVARPLLDHLPADERPVAVEPGTTDPTTLLHRVAGAAADGRLCLFVAGRPVARTVREVLASGGVRADRDGLRTFYEVPDRVPCADGSLGACRTEADLTWCEVPVGGERRLVLLDGGARAAVFDGVDALAGPPPHAAAFPYTYRRGEDKRLHVTDRGGREVGVFNTVRAMKSEAYRPVPEPLVPEHVFRAPTRLDDAWAVAVVEDGRLAEVVTA